MPHRRRAKILIVDDDTISSTVLAQALSADHQVFLAATGKGAIEQAQEQQPDLILLDINMPDMDGYKVCRQLKNNPKTRSMPVIFITGMDSEEDEVKGLRLGAADYLTKPFHMPLVTTRVALQIDLKRKTDLLEKLADLDGLTGISNRRRFDIKFDEEWRRLGRRSSPLSLCIMDVDYFKQYNDNYGHAQGDKCLKTLAQELDATAQRAGDAIARYGGEEFVMLLPDTEFDNALEVVARLHRKVNALALPHKYSPCSEHVTMSFGVATAIPGHQHEKQALLGLADEQLYLAKEQGRNRICGQYLAWS